MLGTLSFPAGQTAPDPAATVTKMEEESVGMSDSGAGEDDGDEGDEGDEGEDEEEEGEEFDAAGAMGILDGLITEQKVRFYTTSDHSTRRHDKQFYDSLHFCATFIMCASLHFEQFYEYSTQFHTCRILSDLNSYSFNIQYLLSLRLISTLSYSL
jgi:hypothetical protein